MQIEHELDVDTSIVYPHNVYDKKVFKKLNVGIIFDEGPDSDLLKNLIDLFEHNEEYMVPYPNLALDGTTIKLTKETFDKLTFKLTDIFDPTTKYGLPFEFDYAMYEGSQTEPPCTEDAYWIVPAKTAFASVPQLKFISSLFKIKPSRRTQR